MSLIIPFMIVTDAVKSHETVFGTLVYLTSQKVNLLIFFNGVVVVILLFTNLLIWIFFGDIRIIE